MKKIFILLFGSMLAGQPSLFAQAQFINYNIDSPSAYCVQNLEALNSKHLDYAALPYGNGVVFTSTRGNGGAFSCNNDFDSGNYSDLYYAEMNVDGAYQNPELMRGKMNGKYHDGVVTFTPDGNKMYFSRNNAKGMNQAGVKELKIYSADLKDNVWGDFQEVTFNNEDFATCHPTLSADGMTMYFASDIPGGQGGMDIYKTTKNGDDWSQPVNLGPTVNTDGNEIFPFVDSKGTVYFSSNGHAGQGGLDIFSTTFQGGKWTAPINISAPVNSPMDDFGFTSFAGGKKGFLTSNRKGGNGKDDIYEWTYNGTPVLMANICVVDARDNSRISDASFSLGDKAATTSENGTLTNAGLELTSIMVDGKKYMVFKDQTNTIPSMPSVANFGKSCDIQMPVKPNESYQFSISKPGYQPANLTISGRDLLANDEYLIPLEKVLLRKKVNGLVKNDADNSPIPFSYVKIKNNCTNQVFDVQADANGVFDMQVDCNCNYTLVGSQTNFKDGNTNLDAQNFGCDKLPETIEVALKPTPKSVAPKPVAPKPVNPLVEGKDEKMYVGKIIQLDKLFYDYDKDFIRSDAAIELDKVVSLMKEYSSMTIELGSHTDSRGSDTYNQDLSQRRATSAVEYIISKGISRNRLTAKGYGETSLVNKCSNGVKCSDSEHQINRRTEIKVVNFDEKNVRIID